MPLRSVSGQKRCGLKVCLTHNTSSLISDSAVSTLADVRETHKLVVAHINKARTIPQLEHATVVLILESNLAFEAQHIMHNLNERGVKRWIALSEGAGGTVGWLTVCGNASKQYGYTS
eukprot:7391939-Prymnesium_polylepis.2